MFSEVTILNIKRTFLAQKLLTLFWSSFLGKKQELDIRSWIWGWKVCHALIDEYAKDVGPEVVWHLCSFYQDPLR